MSIIPGYMTTAEAAEIITQRAAGTIQRWCYDGKVDGAKQINMGKNNIWIIPNATVHALAKSTPSTSEQLRRNGAAAVKKLSKTKTQAATPNQPTRAAIDRLLPEHTKTMEFVNGCRRQRGLEDWPI